MSELEKETLTTSAKGLAKWFSVRVEIKIFGNTIWEFTYPPKQK